MKRNKSAIQAKRVDHWVKQIDRMLDNRHKKFAHETLRGIKQTIQETGKVTDKQVRAIKNCQHGRNMAYN